jgi:hypothetical protein
MLAAASPAVVATAPVDKPPDVVVVSRDTRNDVLASRDTPLPLVKGARTEDALLRQAIVVTSTLIVVRPSAGAGEQVLRWTYAPYLQRQLCFTSMTGLFSCAGAEVEELTQRAAGEAPLPAAPSQAAPRANPAAEAARNDIATDLRARAPALFDADQRLNVDPMLRAAGVSIRQAPRSVGRRHP